MANTRLEFTTGDGQLLVPIPLAHPPLAQMLATAAEVRRLDVQAMHQNVLVMYGRIMASKQARVNIPQPPPYCPHDEALVR